jgi:hypothetical protein
VTHSLRGLPGRAGPPEEERPRVGLLWGMASPVESPERLQALAEQ